jgi:hypothetical protein
LKKRKYKKKKSNQQAGNNTDVEASTIIKVINFTIPFVPDKENYNNVAHQIPFLLTANRVIRSAGYPKQVSMLTPLASSCYIHILLIDTVPLVCIVCFVLH